MRHPVAVAGLIFAFVFSVANMACEPPETDDEPDEAEAEISDDGPEGIDDGGITSIPDDPELVEKGEELFNAEGCSGCHQMENDAAGPALGDVTDRRSASWLAKQIMHPGEMGQQDPQSQALREEYPAPMPATNLDAQQTRALLAYLGSQ